MSVHLHCDISEPRDGGHPAVLVLSLHAEEGQPRQLPAGASQEVGAGSLEVIEEPIKGVVMGVSEHHTSAGSGGLAVKGSFLLLTGLQRPTWSLLALQLVFKVEAATSLGALLRQPEDFSTTVKTP